MVSGEVSIFSIFKDSLSLKAPSEKRILDFSAFLERTDFLHHLKVLKFLFVLI